MSRGPKGQPRQAGVAGPAALSLALIIPNPKLKLLDQVREVMRLRHYSIRTEQCYCDWIRRFIKFHQMRSRDELLGGGGVYLPWAIERKYAGAATEWKWQYVFPARGLSKDPRSGRMQRHHVDEATIQKAIRAAVQRLG